MTDSSSKALMDLPDELLSCVVDHCDLSTTQALQLAAKRFVGLCRAALWAEVELDDDYDSHDELMYHLVKNGLATHVRTLTFPLLPTFSRTSCFLLAKSFPNVTQLTVTRDTEDDDDEEELHIVLPSALTEALQQLGLRRLILNDIHEVHKSFSLAQLPHLSHFSPGSLIVAESLLANAPSTLRSLAVLLNDFGVSAVEACVDSLEVLQLSHDPEEEQGSAASNQRFARLRKAFSPSVGP